MIREVAFLSMHTSPLDRPGSGEAGGMNVCIDELAAALGRREVEVTVFTRRTDPELPEEIDTPGGYRVRHVDAGPPRPLPVSALGEWVGPFADRGGREHRRTALRRRPHRDRPQPLLAVGLVGPDSQTGYRAAPRQLLSYPGPGQERHPPPRTASGAVAAHRRRERGHLVFGLRHCLHRVRSRRADRTLRSGPEPAVASTPRAWTWSFSAPAAGARPGRASASKMFPRCCSWGRIQALKGLDVAIEALAAVRDRVPNARMMVVGGPSGPAGESEYRLTRSLVDRLGLEEAVAWLGPQPHRCLPVFYQAADVLVVPSRSESFGLVAAEAQAAGLPVVAANMWAVCGTWCGTASRACWWTGGIRPTMAGLCRGSSSRPPCGASWPRGRWPPAGGTDGRRPPTGSWSSTAGSWGGMR